MTLRPHPCRWFELLSSRGDLAPILIALAHSGSVELQTAGGRAAPPLVVGGAAPLLAHFRELARAFQAHWPAPALCPPPAIADPAATLAARIAQLDAWRADAEAPIAERERLAAQLRALADIAGVLEAGAAQLPAPELIAAAGRCHVAVQLYALAGAPVPAALAPGLLQLVIHADGAGGDYLLLAGSPAELGAADLQFAGGPARRIVWPDDLRGSAEEALRQLAERRAALQARDAEVGARLDALAARHDLAGALAEIGIVAWLVGNGAELSESEYLARVTGWTTAPSEQALFEPIARLGLCGIVRFTDPPPGAEPPVLLANPPWMRAFETFARLLGQPGLDEADPTPAVALIAPLLFGFMFGDIGQGAVLCVAGWLLRRRVPMLALLLPGGVVAMVFGALFGSVFAREDIVPALWLRPLAAPVELLAVAVGIGAAILLGGLALNAAEALWRHAARAWWQREAGLMLAYAALLAAPWHPAALALVGGGALWFVLGPALADGPGRLARLGGGIAEFAEKGLQLLVNTVSFARVGAFALAHAGLSAAVTVLAAAAGDGAGWIVLLLGNLLILALEGLVVGIQTTRLVLFEFFVRFLQGTGRVFHALPPPDPRLMPTPHPP